MTRVRYKVMPDSQDFTSTDDEHRLVLLNDDIHTFDYVIDALIEICDHTSQQATQCTLIVHYKGSCDVKKGSLAVLKPMKKALLDKELDARII